MKRSLALLLALTACAGGAHDVVGPARDPATAPAGPTTTLATLAPESLPGTTTMPEPVEQSGEPLGQEAAPTSVPPRAATGRASSTIPANSIANGPLPSGRCGGDLPPCWVLGVESGGDIRVWNGGCYAPVGHAGPGPCGSTASGKWQFLRSTWAWFRGYLNAADAPEWVQDEKARLTWAGGLGCSHWSAC